MSKKKIGLIVFAVILIASQLISPTPNNKPIDEKLDILSSYNAPSNISTMLKAACYDCHSNKTNYPWYSKIGPVAWFLNNHVKGGLKKLNFNEFQLVSEAQKSFVLNKACEQMQDKNMPLGSYARLHPEAKLSEAQVEQLCAWFKTIK